jgi:hypothetical protein
MTISTQNSTKQATPKQLGLLSRLCQERGVTYTKPRDRADASQQIEALLAMKRSSPFERIEDRRAIRTGFDGWGGATAIRDEEVVGYGSTAQWG